MKRVKKLSSLRNSGLHYKGQYIDVNSAYRYGGCNTVLFYCPVEEVELYFKAAKFAKRYLDSIHHVKRVDVDNGIPF